MFQIHQHGRVIDLILAKSKAEAMRIFGTRHGLKAKGAKAIKLEGRSFKPMRQPELIDG